MNTAALSKLAKIVITSLTNQGVDIETQFGTPERFHNFVIALAIQGVIDIGGLELPAAYDLVMGDGAYLALSDAVWEALQEVQA